MHHTEIRRALNNLVNRRHNFFLIEGTLRYECFLIGGRLGFLLVVRLGRRLLKNNYFCVQEGLACVATSENVMVRESVSA
jgi:hypothetical protein